MRVLHGVARGLGSNHLDPRVQYGISMPVGVIFGFYWGYGKENGNYREYRVHIRVILHFGILLAVSLVGNLGSIR